MFSLPLGKMQFLSQPCSHPAIIPGCVTSPGSIPLLCVEHCGHPQQIHTLLQKPQGLYFHGISCKHRSHMCQRCVAALLTFSQCSQFLPGHQRRKKYFASLGTSKEDSGDGDSADILCNSLTHDFWEYSFPVQSWFPLTN